MIIFTLAELVGYTAWVKPYQNITDVIKKLSVNGCWDSSWPMNLFDTIIAHMTAILTNKTPLKHKPISKLVKGRESIQCKNDNVHHIKINRQTDK